MISPKRTFSGFIIFMRSSKLTYSVKPQEADLEKVWYICIESGQALLPMIEAKVEANYGNGMGQMHALSTHYFAEAFFL